MGWQARPGQWCNPTKILTGCLVIQAVDLGQSSLFPTEEIFTTLPCAQVSRLFVELYKHEAFKPDCRYRRISLMVTFQKQQPNPCRGEPNSAGSQNGSKHRHWVQDWRGQRRRKRLLWHLQPPLCNTLGSFLWGQTCSRL